MARGNKKSRGRNLQRTETQAAIDVSRYVSNERGRTDGKSRQSAVSGITPNLRRKTPRTFRNPNLTRDDLASMPRDATVYVTARGIAKLAEYRGELRTPQTAAQSNYRPNGGHDEGTPRASHSKARPDVLADIFAEARERERAIARKHGIDLH